MVEVISLFLERFPGKGLFAQGLNQFDETLACKMGIKCKPGMLNGIYDIRYLPLEDHLGLPGVDIFYDEAGMVETQHGQNF